MRHCRVAKIETHFDLHTTRALAAALRAAFSDPHSRSPCSQRPASISPSLCACACAHVFEHAHAVHTREGLGRWGSRERGAGKQEQAGATARSTEIEGLRGGKGARARWRGSEGGRGGERYRLTLLPSAKSLSSWSKSALVFFRLSSSSISLPFSSASCFESASSLAISAANSESRRAKCVLSTLIWLSHGACAALRSSSSL